MTGSRVTLWYDVAVLRLFLVALHAALGVFRARADLVIENIALRQQLAIFKQKQPRPSLSDFDRIFWVLLRRLWSRWIETLIVVKPETVVRWHREGFRRYWRWKSRRRGRPQTRSQLRQLIRQMATENAWGAPRIHAELLKLGICVGERTVSRHMPKRPITPDAVERWKTFLRGHRDVLCAMDFFTVPTATFRVIYVLFVIHHERRRILHVNVTMHPTAAWIVQQMRDAFPFDSAPRYLIFDRDTKFGEKVQTAIKNMGTEGVITGYRAPWQNGVAERWIGSVRRELLDHVVVGSENHLRRLLGDYLNYYHLDRCHLSLSKDAPETRAVQPKPSLDATIVSLRRVDGLHHRYTWGTGRRAA